MSNLVENYKKNHNIYAVFLTTGVVSDISSGEEADLYQKKGLKEGLTLCTETCSAW